MSKLLTLLLVASSSLAQSDKSENQNGIFQALKQTGGGFNILSAFAQGREVLKQFVGKWKAMLSFTASGGRFTASLAEPVDVKQPNPNTIEFSLKPVAG